MLLLFWPGPVALGTQVERTTTYVSQASNPAQAAYRLPPVKRVSS